LYSGINSALFGVAATQGIYYYSYEFFRSYFERYLHRKELGDLLNLLIASLSGSIAVLFTNPFWVINVRMSLQNKSPKLQNGEAQLIAVKESEPKGSIATLLELLETDGIAGLWRGVIPALVLVSNPAIQYMIFERLKVFAKQRKANHTLSALDFFLLGAVGKMIATIVTYPYIVVKSRLQMKRESISNDTAKTLDILKNIWKFEGFLGFFKGMQSKLIQSVLNAAFLFVAKEEMVLLIQYIFLLIKNLKEALLVSRRKSLVHHSQ